MRGATIIGDRVMSTMSADWSDAELMVRMRREEAGAFREYFVRLHALLVHEARRLGVQPALRDETVNDCMGDVALELMEPDATLPISLTAHLLAALRHRVSNDRRRRQRRERYHASAVDDACGTGELVVREASSEYALQASDATRDAASVPPTIARLAEELDRKLTDDDRTLLAWLGEWVPQTTIAVWLGISFGAARVRVHRLRERLRAAALTYAAGLSAAEQRELDRFLERRSTNDANGVKREDVWQAEQGRAPKWKGTLQRRAEDIARRENQ